MKVRFGVFRAADQLREITSVHSAHQQGVVTNGGGYKNTYHTATGFWTSCDSGTNYVIKTWAYFRYKVSATAWSSWYTIQVKESQIGHSSNMKLC